MPRLINIRKANNINDGMINTVFTTGNIKIGIIAK